MWPEPALEMVEPESAPANAEPEPVTDAPESVHLLPPLHLCEVPPEMYPARELLAMKWAGRDASGKKVPAPAKKAKAKPRKRKAA